MIERRFETQGREHQVFSTVIGNERHVLKRPLPSTLCMLQTFFPGATSTIRDELVTAQKRIENTDIVIPPTRLFPFHNGYVISQPYIEEDHSVDLEEFLSDHTIQERLNEYDVKPPNFISHEGVVYWVDPTKGKTRILEYVPFLPRTTYKHWKEKVRRVFNISRR